MSATMVPETAPRPLPPKILRLGWIFLAVGLLLLAVAYLVEPGRAPFSVNVLFLYVTSLASGAIFLVALEYIAGAVWSVPMRRVNEFLTGLTPLAVLVAIPVFLQMGSVFHWAHEGAMEADAILAGKKPYLNFSFFSLRFLIVFVIWGFFALMFVRNSVRQDESRDQKLTTWNIRLAGLFMPVFAFTITVVAIDWGMSLEAHWFSTIYGVYYFSGTAVAAVAAATYIIVKLQETGYLPFLRRDHLYSLGALEFAFINFWAYIAFSQFLLIWYANLPEETTWFIARWQGGWMWISILLIVVQFGVPYFALLSQDAKMDPMRLKFMSLWILMAHFVDLYWLVMPTYSPDFSVGISDAAVPFIVVGLVMLVLVYKFRKYRLVPIGDPKLQRGLDFHL